MKVSNFRKLFIKNFFKTDYTGKNGNKICRFNLELSNFLKNYLLSIVIEIMKTVSLLFIQKF